MPRIAARAILINMSDELLNQAIALCKSGDKHKADILLRHILRSDPHNERAWVWLADAQPDGGARLHILRAFRRANPESRVAQQALEHFSAQAGAQRSLVAKPAAPAPGAPKAAVKSASGGLWKIPLFVFGGIILIGLLAFLLIWFLRSGQVPAGEIQPSAQAPIHTATLSETRIPRLLPTPLPTATEATCDCKQALAYLERSAARIKALQNDMLLAADYVERLPESKADFATLSGWGRARYEQQHADLSPQCLMPLHQKMVTYFASWWHAMDAIALGEYNNAAAFLASFREKEAEIYVEAQGWMEEFLKCAPIDDGAEDQIG